MKVRDLRRRVQATARMIAGRRAGSRGSSDPPAVDGLGDLPFDPTAIESRLVWIMGSPRTGSTWLLRMLIHPWILARGAPTGMRSPLRARRSRLPDVVPVDEPYMARHLTPRVHPELDGDRQPDPREFLLNTERAGEPGYLFSDRYAPVWRQEVRRLILVRFWSQAELASRRHDLTDPLLLIKEPSSSYAADALLSLLPESRLIFLVRDGRDVVDSMVHARESWSPEPGLDLDSDGARLVYIRVRSREWLNATTVVQRAHASRSPGQRAMVRYEDLRRDPEGRLRPILGWLGIERDPRLLRETVEANAFEALPAFMRGPGTTRRAASPGLWRENTTREEQEVMNAIMGPKLAELGYDV